jgi:hypothetical protein
MLSISRIVRGVRDRLDTPDERARARGWVVSRGRWGSRTYRHPLISQALMDYDSDGVPDATAQHRLANRPAVLGHLYSGLTQGLHEPAGAPSNPVGAAGGPVSGPARRPRNGFVPCLAFQATALDERSTPDDERVLLGCAACQGVWEPGLSSDAAREICCPRCGGWTWLVKRSARVPLPRLSADSLTAAPARTTRRGW